MASFKAVWVVFGLIALSHALRLPRQAFSNSSTITFSLSSTAADFSQAGFATRSSTTAPAETSLALATAPASITNSANSTHLSNSTSTASETTGTCCYVRPNAVGVNSWYTSAYNVPVATVITTWIQHGNSTPIPQNSITVTRANATAPYGWYSWTIGEVLTSFHMITITNPVMTSTITQGVDSYIWQPATGPERFPGVPNTLLPVRAQMYASSQVLSATTMAYPLQSLTFTSPTPFLWFSQVWIRTSAPCVSTFPGAGGEKPIMRTSVVVMPIPESQYSGGFTFDSYMASVNMTQEGDNSNLYQFDLPADFPQWLAKIPQVVETWPGIGSCTNAPGQGEPTVHIPVSSLTAKSDVIITMAPTITNGGGSGPTTTVGREPSPAPVVTDDVPVETGLPVENEEPQGSDGPGGSDAPSSPGAETGNTAPTDLGGPTSLTGDVADSPAQGAPPGTTAVANIGDLIASIIGLIPSAQQPAENQEPVEAIPTNAAQNGQAGQLSPEEGNDSNNGQSPQEQNAPQPSSAAKITVGGDIISANPDGTFEIGTQILQPGGVAIIAENGAVLSLAPSGTAIISDDNTIPVDPTASAITLPDSTLTANAEGAVVVGSQTLQPGGAEITAAGSVFSLQSDGSAIVIDGRTTPFALDNVATAAAGAPSVVSATINGVILSTGSEGEYLVGTQTLVPGSEITFSSTTYSLASDGGALVVNGQTSTIDDPAVTITAAPILISAGAGVVTAGSEALPFTSLGGDVVIGGTTLASGEAAVVVVNGHTLSLLNPSQIVVVSGSVTRTLELNPTSTVVVTRTRSGTSSTDRGTGTPGGQGSEETNADPFATETSGAEGSRVVMRQCLASLVLLAVGFVGFV